MIKTSLILFVAVLATASAFPTFSKVPSLTAEVEAMFNKWAAQHNKFYTDETVGEALDNFNQNLHFINTHNDMAKNGLKTYTVALNKFADLSREQYRKMLGFRGDSNAMKTGTPLANSSVPDSVDWRKKGAVSPVKDQGQCGSCWAFSATGALEGANFIKTGKLVSLSEQEFLDCDTVDNACNGGLMDNAFQFVMNNTGIDSEKDWPYLAREASVDKCPAKHLAKKVATCSNYTDVPPKDESQLQLASAKQPVSIAIEADQQGFQFYESGIFNDDCGTNLDHGVLLVGYGTEDGQDYWIVKNSWGTMFGEDGYIRMARNIADKSGICGITLAASYPTA